MSPSGCGTLILCSLAVKAGPLSKIAKMVKASSITWNSSAYHNSTAFSGSLPKSAANFPSFVIVPSLLNMPSKVSFCIALCLIGLVMDIFCNRISLRSVTSGRDSRKYNCVWSISLGWIGSLNGILFHWSCVTNRIQRPSLSLPVLPALCSDAAFEHGIVACTLTLVDGSW